MTSREAFEAWRNPGKHAGNVSAWVAPGRYENDTHQLAWLAWQAAYEAGRKAERSECERLCARSWEIGGTLVAKEFAEAIRERGKP